MRRHAGPFGPCASSQKLSCRGPVALLVCAPLEVDHLSRDHSGCCGNLRSAFDPHRGFPVHEFSTDHHRRGQRRDAHRPDGSDDHPADRRGGEQRSGPGRCPLDNQPRIGGSGFVLQLERGYGADAAAGECRPGAHPEHAAFYRTDRNAPARFRKLPDSRLQPHLGQGPANATLGTGDLRSEAAAEPA